VNRSNKIKIAIFGLLMVMSFTLQAQALPVENFNLADNQLPKRYNTTYTWQCDPLLQTCTYAEMANDWRSAILPDFLNSSAYAYSLTNIMAEASPRVLLTNEVPRPQETHYAWRCDDLLQNCVYAEMTDDWHNLVLPAILNQPALITAPSDWEKNVFVRRDGLQKFSLDEVLIKQKILADLPALLTAKNDWERAVLLRNYVYSHVMVGSGDISLLPLTFESFIKSITGKNKLMCGGMAIMYAGSLKLFDIPVHIINLATDKMVCDNRYADETHVTNEVFLDKSWILQDPTFNVHWEIFGKTIGVIQLAKFVSTNPFAELIHKQLTPILGVYTYGLLPGSTTYPNSDGFTINPEQSIENYYLNYKDLLAHIDIKKMNIFEEQDGKVLVAYPSGFSWQYLIISREQDVERLSGKFPIVKKWVLTQDNLPDWKISNALWIVSNNISNDKKLKVITDASMYGYQLNSKSFLLEPGSYSLQLIGKIVKGGMGLYILDEKTDQFLGSAFFYQKISNGKLIYCNFKNDIPRNVKVVLANFSYEGKSSVWELKEIKLRKFDFFSELIIGSNNNHFHQEIFVEKEPGIFPRQVATNFLFATDWPNSG